MKLKPDPLSYAEPTLPPKARSQLASISLGIGVVSLPLGYMLAEITGRVLEPFFRFASASLIDICIASTFVPTAVAILAGRLALSEIEKSNGRLGGRRLAIAGMISGVVTVLLIVFAPPSPC